MYIHRDVILDSKSMTFNQTHAEDLAKQGLLQSLLLIMSSDQVSPYGSAGGDWRLLDKLDDIEIVGNGGKVVRSLKAKEHAYFSYLTGRKTQQDMWRNYASNTQFCVIPISFGRKWNDREWALDLGNWDQVQLKVKNTATSSTFTTDIKLSVIAQYLRDVPRSAVRGYMKAEAHTDYVPVAADTKYLNLPTQGKLHRAILHLRPGQDGNGVVYDQPWDMADLITLKGKAGSVEYMDHSAARLAYENWYDLEGEVLTMGQSYHTADKGYDMGVGRPLGWQVGSLSKDGAGSSTVPTMAADNTDFAIVNETYEADSPIAVWVRGQGFHNCLSLPVAWGPDLGDWLDLEANKQVTLDIRTRSGATVTSAKNRVLLERPCTGVDQLL